MMYRERNRAVMVPWYYGIAWEEDFGHCVVYSPLGMNVIIRWLRIVRYWVGGYGKYELYTLKEIHQLGEDAYRDGYADAMRHSRHDSA